MSDSAPEGVRSLAAESHGPGPVARATGPNPGGAGELSKQDQVEAVLALAALDSRRGQGTEAQRSASRKRLPPEVLALYDLALRAGRKPLVAQLVSGICSGCNLRLATSLAQRVRKSRLVLACPHCGRLLYELAGAEPPRAARSPR
jgi:hypothetical protein